MRGPISLSVVQRAHQRFLNRHKAEFEKASKEVGDHAQQEAKRTRLFKRRSPVGKSAKDIPQPKYIRTSRGHVVRVATRNKVARFMEHGTKPHVIRARRRKALRFRGVFARSVFHPGTRPTRFLFKASNSAFRFGRHIYQSAQARAAKRF